MTISVFLRIGRQVPFVNVYIYIYIFIYLFIYLYIYILYIYIYTNHILKPSQTPGVLEQSFSVLVSRGQPIFSCWMWPLVTLLQSDTTFFLAANVQWDFFWKWKIGSLTLPFATTQVARETSEWV